MEDRQLLRIADRVHDALLQLQQRYYLECLRRLTLLTNTLNRVSPQSRKLSIALAKEWSASCEKSCICVQRTLTEIPKYVIRTQEMLTKRKPKIPAVRSLFEEVKAVEAEFGNIQLTKPENSISVLTEPITLEGIYLGPFRIALFLDMAPQVYNQQAYAVYATEPNPAATDSTVTHPHVSSDSLCEGDGHAAIWSALEAGRLLDFFMLIRSILNTYNSGGAYVQLEDWDGLPCYECGYVMQSDEYYYCRSCENEFCDQCSTCCESCHEIICLNCAGRCQVCEEPLCQQCQIECSQCERICCESCLEEGICSDCREEMENNDEQKTKKQQQKEPEQHNLRLVG